MRETRAVRACREAGQDPTDSQILSFYEHQEIEKRYPTIDKGYSRYGADMGRRSYGNPEDAEDHSIRVFHLPLDSGGYDPGGAYWGVRYSGTRIYVATDGGDYRRTVEAFSRAEAIEKLKIPTIKLKRVN